MITVETLESAGYTRYPNPTRDGAWNPWVWQKRFRDEVGTRYFIDVTQYDWHALPNVHSRPSRYSYEADVDLYDENEDTTMRVKVLSERATASVEALEAWVENLWRVTSSGYYERDAN